MSFEGLIISLTLLVISALWISVPLLNRKLRQGADEATKQRLVLITDYDRLLDNLRDLDEDFSTGKLLASDYEPEREVLIQRGIQLLIELDQWEDRYGKAAPVADPSLDREIEQAVRTYRKHARRAHS